MDGSVGHSYLFSTSWHHLEGIRQCRQLCSGLVNQSTRHSQERFVNALFGPGIELGNECFGWADDGGGVKQTITDGSRGRLCSASLVGLFDRFDIFTKAIASEHVCVIDPHSGNVV